MKNKGNKKHWVTPSVEVLDIKKDTFSGSSGNPEQHSWQDNLKADGTLSIDRTNDNRKKR